MTFAGSLASRRDTEEERDDVGGAYHREMQDSGTGCHMHLLVLEANVLHTGGSLAAGNMEVECDAATDASAVIAPTSGLADHEALELDDSADASMADAGNHEAGLVVVGDVPKASHTSCQEVP